MRILLLLVCALLALFHRGLSSGEPPQPDSARTIEGYWQDTARRITFAREAPPAHVYGGWTALDPEQTYPSAKQIRKSGGAYELVDLLYDDDYPVKIIAAGDDRIEFVRSDKWSACAIRHRCRLYGAELFCSLESVCQEAGQPVLDWRSEERYVRRAACARQGSRQAQGIPVRCN